MSNDGPSGPPTNAEDLLTRIETLTLRESEVLDLILKGLSNDQIALALFRSPKTVDKHCQRIYRKLGIHKRVNLFRLCLEAGYEGAQPALRSSPPSRPPRQPLPAASQNEYSLIEQLVLKGRAWDTLQAIHARLAGAHDDDFFQQVASALAEIFQVKLAGVCEINASDGYGDIIACCDEGKLLEPIRYDLHNSACGVAHADGELQITNGFVERFGPRQRLDLEYEIESYIGVGLRDYTDGMIGTVWIADDMPAPVDGMRLDILRLLAPTVAAALAVKIRNDQSAGL